MRKNICGRDIGAGLAACAILAAMCITPPPAAAAATGSAPMAGKPSVSKPLPDDPAKVAAASEFVQLYHPRSNLLNIAAMLDRTVPRMAAQAKQQDKKLDVKAYARDLKARIMERTRMMLDVQARVVSRHFTLTELKQLIAFCKSPLGQKLIAETPAIQRDVMIEAQHRAMPPVPHGLLRPGSMPPVKPGPVSSGAAKTPTTPGQAGK